MQTQTTAVVETTRGDEIPAFRDLVLQYQRTVYAFALDLTGNHHDAEDLSQEVFIKVYRSLQRFRGEAKLSSWLYRITMNTYLNKRRKKALRFLRLYDRLDEMDHPVEENGSPDQEAQAEKVRYEIDRALQCLSPKERIAFILRHYRELPIKEVAAVMEVADGTVKSLLFRAVNKLRDKLAGVRADLT